MDARVLTGDFGIISQVTNQFFLSQTYKLAVKVRGCLVGIIYREMLTIRAESANSSSAMSLMSGDVETITLATRCIVDIVPNCIQIGLAMWILNLQIGVAFVAPVLVSLLCAAVGGWLGKLLPPQQRIWMQAIQKRTGITSSMLGAMKGIKMTGLSRFVNKQIQDLRKSEVQTSLTLKRLLVGNAMMSESDPLDLS